MARYYRRRARSTSYRYGARRSTYRSRYSRSRSRRRVSRRSSSRTVRIVVQTVAASPTSMGMKSIQPVRARF